MGLLSLSSSDHTLVIFGSNSKFLVVDVGVKFSLCLLVEEVDYVFLLIARIVYHSLSSLVENVNENGLLTHDRQFDGLLDKATLSLT